MKKKTNFGQFLNQATLGFISPHNVESFVPHGNRWHVCSSISPRLKSSFKISFQILSRRWREHEVTVTCDTVLAHLWSLHGWIHTQQIYYKNCHDCCFIWLGLAERHVLAAKTTPFLSIELMIDGHSSAWLACNTIFINTSIGIQILQNICLLGIPGAKEWNNWIFLFD